MARSQRLGRGAHIDQEGDHAHDEHYEIDGQAVHRLEGTERRRRDHAEQAEDPVIREFSTLVACGEATQADPAALVAALTPARDWRGEKSCAREGLLAAALKAGSVHLMPIASTRCQRGLLE